MLRLSDNGPVDTWRKNNEADNEAIPQNAGDDAQTWQQQKLLVKNKCVLQKIIQKE